MTAAAAPAGCGAPAGGAPIKDAGNQAVVQGRVTRTAPPVPVGYARLLNYRRRVRGRGAARRGRRVPVLRRARRLDAARARARVTSGPSAPCPPTSARSPSSRWPSREISSGTARGPSGPRAVPWARSFSYMPCFRRLFLYLLFNCWSALPPRTGAGRGGHDTVGSNDSWGHGCACRSRLIRPGSQAPGSRLRQPASGERATPRRSRRVTVQEGGSRSAFARGLMATSDIDPDWDGQNGLGPEPGQDRPDAPRREASRPGVGVLADRIAAALVHHEPGWRLPRHTTLARRYNVSTAEIDAAVSELTTRHLIRRLADGQLYRVSPAEYLIPIEGVPGLGLARWTRWAGTSPAGAGRCPGARCPRTSAGRCGSRRPSRSW